MLKCSWEDEEERIYRFLNQTLEETGTNGYVVGVSGGLDSTVVARLVLNAVGQEKTTLIYMPTEDMSTSEVEANLFKIKRSLEYKYVQLVQLSLVRQKEDIATANYIARLRMATLYGSANNINRLVCGTTDRSEEFIGYFTKFGDGACDVEPIIHLTKTQVRELANYLKLPKEIVEKPSSPELWKDQTAEGELGFSYEVLDKILALHDETEHKRRMPLRLPE